MSKRIPSLDGLRAVSIILVLLGHLDGTRNFPRALAIVGTYANFGVRVFFVISGYLITSLLLKEHSKTKSINLPEFYRRRAYRILPPAYVYMFVICILAWPQMTAKNVLVTFTYLSNYFVHSSPWVLGHLWSLSVEEQFYLIWPFALALAFPLRTKMAAYVILAAPVLRVVFYFIGLRDIGYYFPTVADAIATGCLLAIVWPNLKRFDSYLLSPFAVLVPLVTLAIPLLHRLGYGGVGSRIYETLGVSLMHVGIAICIYNSIQKRWLWLNHKSIVWIGLISYSLYLWQQPFLNRNDQAHWWTAFPQNVIFAFAMAACSYYLIEQPILRLRDSNKKTAQQPAVEISPEASAA